MPVAGENANDKETLEALRQTARTFVERRLMPLEGRIEDGLDDETWRGLANECASLGLTGLPFPVEYGGGGGGMLAQATVMREFGRTTHSFISRLLMAPDPTLIFGTPEQKERYLRPACEGQLICAFGLTESESGSDAANVSTTARLENGQWVINGSKVFTTRASIADVVITIATTGPGKDGRKELSAFIVPTDSPGFSCGKNNNKVGERAVPQSDTYFDDCRIPEDHILGKVGEGWRITTSWTSIDRMDQAAYCLGSAERCLELAIAHANNRVTFGKRLSENQAIQWMIADSSIECAIAAEMLSRAARDHDAGLDVTLRAAAAKLFSAEAAGRVIDRAQQIHGGLGYMRDLPFDLLGRDVRLGRIGGGTAEMMRLIIARDAVRHSRMPLYAPL